MHILHSHPTKVTLSQGAFPPGFLLPARLEPRHEEAEDLRLLGHAVPVQGGQLHIVPDIMCRSSIEGSQIFHNQGEGA